MSSGKTLQDRLKGQTVQEQIVTLNEALQAVSGLKNKRQLGKMQDNVQKEVQRLQRKVKEKYDSDGPTEKDPRQLTLGIEIEFVLVRDTKVASRFDISDAHRNDVKIAQQAVHHALSQSIQQMCENCGESHSYSLPLNTLPDGSVQPRDQAPAYKVYEKWTVATDGSVDVGELRKKVSDTISIDDRKHGDFQSHGIEVKSRILSLTDSLKANTLGSCTHRPTVTYQDEIAAAYELLRKAFLDPTTRIDNGAWCLLNTEKCGLHVHVGNGVSTGDRRFPLATVKNVVSMSTANERAIDNLHAKNRINGTTIMLDPTLESERDDWDRLLDHSVFNKPFSAQFGYMAYANRSDSEEWIRATGKNKVRKCFPNALFEQRPGLKPDAQANDAMSWLRVVDEAREIEDLRDLQAMRHHFSTVNLGNLRQNEIGFEETAVVVSSFTNTIEFRQAAGTVDPVAALAWVDVVVKFVEHCHNTSQAAMSAECLRICQDTRHHTLDFLATIGLGKKDAAGIVRPGRSKSATWKHYKSVLGFYQKDMDYASTLRRRELATAAAFVGQDNFYSIRVANAHLNYDQNNPKAVNRRIEEKFLNICFGQFSTQYLKDLADPAHWPLGRESLLPKLTIGWRYSAPEPSSSPTISDQELNPQDEGRYIKDSDPDSEEDRMLASVDRRNAARAAPSPFSSNNNACKADSSNEDDSSSAEGSSSSGDSSSAGDSPSAEDAPANDSPADEPQNFWDPLSRDINAELDDFQTNQGLDDLDDVDIGVEFGDDSPEEEHRVRTR